MKLRIFALAWSAAVALPTFAYAEPLEVINVVSPSAHDQVLVSFVRDLYREPVAYKTLPTVRDADPLDAVNAALRCGNSATINASIASGHISC